MEFKRYKLGEFIESVSDTTQILKDKVVLINTSDVKNGYVINHTYTLNKNLKGQFKKRFKKGDILYSEIRPRNRRFAYIDFESDDYIASTKLMVLRNKGNIDNEFLFQLLKSNEVIEYLQLLAESRSGTFPQITFNELANTVVSIPSMENQQKISRILTIIDNKIRYNTHTNDNLLEISQTIYDNYIKENSNLKYSKIMDLNPRLETGKRPSGGVNDINSGVPSIGAESIKGLGFFDYSKTKYISEEYFTKMKKGIVKGYEVLIYKDGGRPGYFTPNFSMFGEGFPYNKCALNEHVFLLDFNDIKFNVFAYYYFNSIETRNKLHVLGSKSAAIPGINQQDILNLEIPSVENKSINEIIDILMLNTKKILKNSYQNYTLAKLRDTLLPKLMDGEIDLDKVEI